MSKSGKKPRRKVDSKKYETPSGGGSSKKEKDWSFDDIARSKTRRS